MVADGLLFGISVQVPMAAAAKSAIVVRTQAFFEDLIGVVRRSICFALRISVSSVATNNPPTAIWFRAAASAQESSLRKYPIRAR